ncbi:MAG TPA: ABC transporter ATP-binding protein [Candidatus Aphodousia faecipullorum]|nr:ABC transporter ATP-binding protein [Candidatus Aphodousia faecipullorum]
MIKLKLDQFGVSYGHSSVLHDIDAKMTGAQVISVIGHNGSGKTTLLKAIAGLIKHQGKISTLRDGHEIPQSAIRYVPQLSTVSSTLSVFEMVLLGLVNSLPWRVTPELFDQVDETLHALEINSLAHIPVNRLSGGQRQLVFLAQAFVSQPKILLLDEPTSALDLRHQLIVMNAVREYTQKQEAITLVIMHDLLTAARFSQQILLLENGTLSILDEPELVLQAQRLERIYNVSVSIEKTASDFLNVVPIKPL